LVLKISYSDETIRIGLKMLAQIEQEVHESPNCLLGLSKRLMSSRSICSGWARALWIPELFAQIEQEAHEFPKYLLRLSKDSRLLQASSSRPRTFLVPVLVKASV